MNVFSKKIFLPMKIKQQFILSVSSTYDLNIFTSDFNNLNTYSKYSMSVGSTSTDEIIVDDLFQDYEIKFNSSAVNAEAAKDIKAQHIAK